MTIRLTRELKRRIYEALPECYLISAEFVTPCPVEPKGKTHRERAVWWARLSAAFLLEALDEENIELDEQRSGVIAKTLGIESQESYLDDPQRGIWQCVLDSLSSRDRERWSSILSENDAAYRQEYEASQEQHVPEPDEPTVDDLWEEGERLAKPVLYLKALRKPKRSNRRTAIWQYRDGMEGDLIPWVTVDLRCHPDPSVRVDGVLEIVRNWPECESEATFLPKRLPQAKRGKKTLYALEAWEVPPPMF